MSSGGFHHLVTDWGGFEKLVAELHETGHFKVERNVVLPARDGGTYEIDVLLTSNVGPYEYRTLVSCKYWNTNVPRKEINDLIQARSQLRAQKAVCFTSSGYQDPSAVAAAKAEGIELFVVRDLLPTEWGRPGRVVTIILQLLEIGIAPALDGPSAIHAPDGDWLAKTDPFAVSVSSPDGKEDGTLEERCRKLRAHAYRTFAEKRSTFHGGIEGSWDVIIETTANFEGGPRILRAGEQSTLRDSFHATAVVRVHQRPIVIDRSKAFDFAVVVEDYINDRSQIVSRRPGQKPIWANPTGATPSETTADSSAVGDKDEPVTDTLLVVAQLSKALPPSRVRGVLELARKKVFIDF